MLVRVGVNQEVASVGRGEGVEAVDGGVGGNDGVVTHRLVETVQ